MKIAKALYYPKRNYTKVLKESKLDETRKNLLIDFIASCKDIKKEDGKALIKYVKDLME